MIIRKICPDDAEQFLRLGKQLDGETRFMLREPDERKITVAEQREESVASTETSTAWQNCSYDLLHLHCSDETGGRNHGRGDPLRSLRFLPDC